MKRLAARRRPSVESPGGWHLSVSGDTRAFSKRPEERKEQGKAKNEKAFFLFPSSFLSGANREGQHTAASIRASRVEASAMRLRDARCGRKADTGWSSAGPIGPFEIRHS